MTRIKKILRVLGLVILITLAAAGAGLTGAFLPGNREPYQNKQIRIEQVDRKEEESEDESASEKSG